MEYNYLEDYYKKHKFLDYLKIEKIKNNKFNLYFNDYKKDYPKLGNFKDYIKISNICKIFQGPAGTYMQEKNYNKIGELKVYEQIHVIKKDLNIDNERFISKKYSYKLQKGKFEILDNDILISMSGTVGESTIYKKNYPKGVISTALSIIRVNDKNLFLPEFISIILENNEIKNWLKKKIKGTANKGIRLRDVKNILIPKIDILKQRKLINKVKNFKSKIFTLEKEVKEQKSLIENVWNQ